MKLLCECNCLFLDKMSAIYVFVGKQHEFHTACYCCGREQESASLLVIETASKEEVDSVDGGVGEG